MEIAIVSLYLPGCRHRPVAFKGVYRVSPLAAPQLASGSGHGPRVS